MAAVTTVVVGGGITGLAAARRCAERGDDVVVLEASDRVGGKLASHVVDGLVLEAGAESLLARRPEGLEMVAATGREADLVHPATSGAGVWLDSVHPLPRLQLLGIPTDTGDPDLPGLLGEEGMIRLLHEVIWDVGAADDMSVAALIGERLGPEVVDRLVEPLLGGVYAGRADEISVESALPGLLAAVRRTGSVVAAAAELRSRSGAEGSLRESPVFASVVGGLGSLPTSVVDAFGLTVRLNTPAVALQRSSSGWSIATEHGQTMGADRIILAVPAFAAAPLLETVAPEASDAAVHLEYASVALVTAVFDSGDVGAPLSGTGFLVPAVTGRLTKAATYVTRKWQWVQDTAAGREVIRFSVGRHGDERGLDLTDDELVAAVLAEVRELLDLRGRPRATAVTRWVRSLPQYRVGHRARVDAARAALPAGLAVAGAAWDGVGIPVCIASGRAAADRVGGPDASG